MMLRKHRNSHICYFGEQETSLPTQILEGTWDYTIIKVNALRFQIILSINSTKENTQTDCKTATIVYRIIAFKRFITNYFGYGKKSEYLCAIQKSQNASGVLG